MNIDPTLVPFSAPRSYLALGIHQKDDWWNEHPAGLFLRTLRTSRDSFFVAHFVPLAPDGSPLAFERWESRPESLRAECAAGSWEFVFADPATILARADRPGLGLRIDFLPAGRSFHLLFPVPAPGAAAPDGTLLLANANKSRAKFLLAARAGRLVPDDPRWDGRDAHRMAANLVAGDAEGADCRPPELAIRECVGDWDGSVPDASFEAARAARAADFDSFLSRLPAAPAEFAETRAAAAHLLWSFSVAKAGFLERDALLMSKNWMDRVWSWDHCFNAIALAAGHPDLAWDSFMTPFDRQADDGSLPDFVSEGAIVRGFVKPPIHGWALRRMMALSDVPDARLAEIYGPLSRWTRWWLDRRDRDGDGLCEYDHGNDSGWDNSTAFLRLPPVETPDLAAFLAIQCDVLADLARRLGRSGEEASAWSRSADAQIAAMDRELFDAEGRPFVRSAYTHERFSPDTLLLRVPVLLGDRLPARLRAPLLADLESDKFLTDWGYATESPASPFYKNDGYWRGPIWAPSTLLLCDGLRACGRPDLARRAAERFCRMCARSGFAENYDALSGEGLRDRAYTWTAAVFLLLASELARASFRAGAENPLT